MSADTRYFHGSSIELPPGTIMRGRGDSYERDWANTDFYAVLERHRPAGIIPHKDAVFMVGHPDDIDLAGGATEWAFEVVPLGTATRHDLNWSSEISMLVSEGYAPDSAEVIQAAKSYWDGIPHMNEQVWEYLATGATILRCEPYEDFEIDYPPVPAPA